MNLQIPFEKLLPMMLRNRVVMNFAVKKLTNVIREKIGAAAYVQLESGNGNTVIKATDGNGHFWKIEPEIFFSFGAGIDIIKMLSFIKIGGKPINIQNIGRCALLVDNTGPDLVLTASGEGGEVIISGTLEYIIRSNIEKFGAGEMAGSISDAMQLSEGERVGEGEDAETDFEEIEEEIEDAELQEYSEALESGDESEE